MVHRKNFNKYELYYITNHNTVPAQLLLYNNTTFCGWVYFYHEHLSLPAPYWSEGGFIVYFKISEFDRIMNILRNEKPLMVLYNDVAKYAGFGTVEKEPVGEMEPPIRLFTYR